MRFLPDGPDIPAELIAAQEKGQTIFVCGAGVSRTVGLPLFRGLVEGIYQHLKEDWTAHIAEREGMDPNGELAGQYDRVLRSLERRLAASNSPHHRGMRERIRAASYTPERSEKVSEAMRRRWAEPGRPSAGSGRTLTPSPGSGPTWRAYASTPPGTISTGGAWSVASRRLVTKPGASARPRTSWRRSPTSAIAFGVR